MLRVWKVIRPGPGIAGPAAESPRFPHAGFAAAVRAALPSLGPRLLAAAAQAQDPRPRYCGVYVAPRRRLPRSPLPVAGCVRRRWAPGSPRSAARCCCEIPTKHCKMRAETCLSPSTPCDPTIFFLDHWRAFPPRPRLSAGAGGPPGRAHVSGFDSQVRRRRGGGAQHVESGFRDVGLRLPDVFVPGRDKRLAGALWAGLRAALGAPLVWGSPRLLKAWPAWPSAPTASSSTSRAPSPASVPAGFAITDSASPVGSGCTPYYAARGQHPRRPRTFAIRFARRLGWGACRLRQSSLTSIGGR